MSENNKLITRTANKAHELKKANEAHSAQDAPGETAAAVTINPRGSQWKFEFMGLLSKPDSLRVFTTAQFTSLVCSVRPLTSSSAARALCALLIEAGAIEQVSHGLFMNRRVSPAVRLQECAQNVRAGSVISLQSVLGACGFLNNVSSADWAVSVLPSSAAFRPKLGDVNTTFGKRLSFFGLSERFFPQNNKERWDLLEPGALCPTFRPEAALLQWLHLAANRRSRLIEPPVDVDMAVLDRALLVKLAGRLGVKELLSAWEKHAGDNHFGHELHHADSIDSTDNPDSADSADSSIGSRPPSSESPGQTALTSPGDQARWEAAMQAKKRLLGLAKKTKPGAPSL